jgi:hypothetical protein
MNNDFDLLSSCLPSPSNDDLEAPAKVKVEKIPNNSQPLKRSVRNNRNNNFKFGSTTSRNSGNNNKKGR